MRLTRGTLDDLPFVMRTERGPGYEHLVGRWDEARHREELAGSRFVYLIAHLGEEPVGFVILRDWGSPEQVAHVKRVVVAVPGNGQGREMMRLVADAVFEETSAWRLWLGLFPDNLRARRAYEAAGFTPEGISRGSAFFGGEHRDELIMAMLRPEWQARRA